MPFVPPITDPVDAVAFPIFKRAAKAKFGLVAIFSILRVVYLLWELYKLAKAAHLFGTRSLATGQMTPPLNEIGDYPPEIIDAIADRANAITYGLPFD
jgi:hypothetical protein